MPDCLFSSIFPYRQHECHSPLENFITEIFAFCLRNDEFFRSSFFRLLKIECANENCFISTQKKYDVYGRPDLEIEFADTIFLVENKVEAGERLNQLNDYASILNH